MDIVYVDILSGEHLSSKFLIWTKFIGQSADRIEGEGMWDIFGPLRASLYKSTRKSGATSK